MIVRPFTMTLDGDWQDVPLPDSFIALQLINKSDDPLEIKNSIGQFDDVQPNGAYTLATPGAPNGAPMKPFSNNGFQVRGTNTDAVKGEVWVFDYQEE